MKWFWWKKKKEEPTFEWLIPRALFQEYHKALVKEFRGQAALMLDIRRGKLSAASEKHLRHLGLKPLNFIGPDDQLEYYRLHKDTADNLGVGKNPAGGKTEKAEPLS